MADTLEAVALRLREFIQAVDRKAGAYMGPAPAGAIRATARKDQKSVTYDECLGELSVEECDEFDRMIRKMSRVLGSPPGAIIPR